MKNHVIAITLIAVLITSFAACGSDKLSKSDAQKQIERWERTGRDKKLEVPEGLYLSSIHHNNREAIFNLLNSDYVTWEKGEEKSMYGTRSFVRTVNPTEKGKKFIVYDADNKKLIVDYFTTKVEVTLISEASNGLRGVTCRVYYKTVRELNELGKKIEAQLPKDRDNEKELTFVKMQDGWKAAYETGEPIFKD